MKRFAFLFIFVFFICTCAYATVNVDNVCSESEDFVLPGVPAVASQLLKKYDVKLATTGQTSLTHDLSSQISDIKNASDSLSFDKASFTLISKEANLDFIQRLIIKHKDIILADVNIIILVSEIKKITIPIKIPKELASSLETGPIKIDIYFTGIIPETSTKVSSKFCTGASVEVSESIIK